MTVDKIYFDMDSVLADFNRGLVELCGLEEGPIQDGDPVKDGMMWAAIKQVDHFYYQLKPMPGAIDMFRAVSEKYGDRCEILTAVPKPKRQIEGAGEDKIRWVREYLSETVTVNIVLKEEKKKMVTGPGSVLIDDMKPNIDSWRESGGTGILHRDTESTMKELRGLGIL